MNMMNNNKRQSVDNKGQLKQGENYLQIEKEMPVPNETPPSKQTTATSGFQKEENAIAKNNEGTHDSNKGQDQVPSNSFVGMLSKMNFKDKIMIHVIDDSKGVKKDFTFSRSLLVKYMKYFEKCLKKISDQDEIDISIHCDAGIFEWLLTYIFKHEEVDK